MHDESLAISGEPPAGASRVPTFPCGPHAAGRRALFRNAAILAIAIGLLVFLGGGIGLRGIDLVLLHEHEVPWVGGALVMMALASAFVYSSRSGGSVALEPQAVVFRGLGWRGRNYRIRYADLRSVRVRRAGFLQAVEIRLRRLTSIRARIATAMNPAIPRATPRIDAPSVHEALRTQPPRRHVIKDGHEVARATLLRELRRPG